MAQYDSKTDNCFATHLFTQIKNFHFYSFRFDPLILYLLTAFEKLHLTQEFFPNFQKTSLL